MFELPQIDEALCNGCGLCLTVCDCGGLVLVGHVIKIVHSAECSYCANCELVCPTGAIRCPYEIVIQETYEITIEEGYTPF
jgi:MinD superfamily P-loop ATPase